MARPTRMGDPPSWLALEGGGGGGGGEGRGKEGGGERERHSTHGSSRDHPSLTQGGSPVQSVYSERGGREGHQSHWQLTHQSGRCRLEALAVGCPAENGSER